MGLLSVRRGLALAMALATPVGCALALGDPGGDVMPPSIDAGVPPKDATTGADHVVATEVGPQDVAVDRAVDTGHDGGASDSTSSDGGGDVRADASDAGRDHAVDAVAVDAHDASVVDAHDASPADAPLEGGYCRNYKVPFGAWFACDDFDEDTDPGAFGGTTAFGSGVTLEVRSDAALSLPNSLFAATNPGAAPNAESGSAVVVALPARSSYTLDFYARVALGPVPSASQFSAIVFGSGAGVSLIFDGGNDGGVVTKLAVAIVYLGGSNGTTLEYATSSFADMPAPLASGWNHFVFSVSGGASAPTYSLVVNGSNLFGGPNILPGNGFFQGPAQGEVGWFFTADNGPRDAYIDNVAVIAQ